MMKRTQIYLEKGTYKTLKQEARTEKRTVSDLIRKVLDQKYGRISLPKPGGARVLLEMAKHASRRKDIPKDLSSNLDKYLVEAIMDE